MKNLREAELEFVKAIANYKPPLHNRKIVTRESIDLHSPELKEKRSVLLRAEKDTRELIDYLEYAVNSFTINIDEIINAVKADRKAYKNLVFLSYAWVDLWNEAEEWRTDERNESSTKLCKEVASAIIRGTNNQLKNGYFPELYRATVNMHRTNVQSATNIFMRVLKEKDRNVKQILENKFQNGYIKLPMI